MGKLAVKTPSKGTKCIPESHEDDFRVCPEGMTLCIILDVEHYLSPSDQVKLGVCDIVHG